MGLEKKKKEKKNVKFSLFQNSIQSEIQQWRKSITVTT